MRIGGCLLTVLIILVIGAVFGLFSWDTVRSFGHFFVYVLIAGLVLLVGFWLWNSSEKD